MSTPSIHSLVGSGYVILKKKYLSFKRSWYPILIVWNTSAFLTFLTYRFYILLNLTILFFYILFLECLNWLVLSTLCPFKLLFHFSYLLSESFFKRKAGCLFDSCIEKCILICFFFSPLKTFSQKILKIWTNKKMKQIEKLFWTMSNLISLFWVEVNQKNHLKLYWFKPKLATPP